MDDLDLGLTLKGFGPGQKLFGRYTLQKMLGRGGMGVVWLARDDELGRETALKFLPEVVATDRSAIEDLKREVRRAINLSHPHIVKIHDFVTDGRTAAVSMEYVKGDTLSSLRIDQPGQVFTTEQLAPWVAQLCAALDYAHAEAEVVHRDLKPANLMIDTRGRLKVLDFGIAASLSESVTRVSKQVGSSGTPVYMSPQQMMGEKPALTDDLYALGATLYELLTGKPPFYAGNIIRQVEIKVPPSLAARREELGVNDAAPIPSEWETVIAACLAKEASGRPQSAGEVAARLGLASSPNVQRSTSSAERSTGGQTGAATTALRTQRAEVGASPVKPQTPNPKSQTPIKTPLIAGIAAVVLLLAGAGWYLGSYAPEQHRLAEIKRLEGESKTGEAQKLKDQQELAAAEAGAQAERERLAAERKTEEGRLAAEPKRKADEEEKVRLDAAAKVEQERVDRLTAEVRAGLAEVMLAWETGTRKQQEAERHLSELKAEQRSSRDMSPGEKARLAALVPVQEEYVQWLNDFLAEHPGRRLQVRTEQFLSARQVDQAVSELASLRSALATFRTEIEARERKVEQGLYGEVEVVPQGTVDSWVLTDSFGQRFEHSGRQALSRVARGPATLVSRRASWPDQTREVHVTAGQKGTVSAMLESAGITLISNAPKAEAFRDGQSLGRLPLTLNDLPPGSFPVEVRGLGYVSRSFTFTTQSGKILNWEAKLEEAIPTESEILADFTTRAAGYWLCHRNGNAIYLKIVAGSPGVEWIMITLGIPRRFTGTLTVIDLKQRTIRHKDGRDPKGRFDSTVRMDGDKLFFNGWDPERVYERTDKTPF